MRYDLTVFGAKDTSAEIIRYISDDLDHRVDLVVTVDTGVTARNDISGFSPLDEVAKACGARLFAADDYKLGSPACVDFFQNNTFDLAICIGWQRLIPSHVLSAFPAGIFGFHGSCAYLPFGRGRSPLNWSLVLGDERYVLNLFRYDEAADSPNVFTRTMFEINPFDTIRTLQYKNMICSKRQIKALLEAHQKGPIPVDTASRDPDSWYSQRTAQDGRLDFTRRTRELYNLIRAVTRPFPGAFCQADDGRRVTIWDAVPFDALLDFSAFAPGEVVDVFDGYPILRTLDGSLLIRDYETDGVLKSGTRLG